MAYHQHERVAEALAGLGGAEQVLVVDNSSDPSVSAEASCAGAEYVDAGGNRGFAGGVNLALGLLAARSRSGDGFPDVLLLNSDARITPSALDALQATFAAPGMERLAAVSPRLRRPNGDLERAAWPFPTPWRAVLEAAGLRRRVTAEDFVVGAVLLLRSEALEDVGLFDEGYFLYAEEADWQRRAVGRGWSVRSRGDLLAEHVGGASSPDQRVKERHLLAGQETFVRRWHGTHGWALFRVAGLVGYGMRGVLRPGESGVAARRRAWGLLRGPRAVAGWPPMPGTRPREMAASEGANGAPG